VPGLAPDDWSTRELMHRMGHGSMRAALAYHAVVGWIDMVLTIAGWPPGISAARLDPDYREQDHAAQPLCCLWPEQSYATPPLT
jgi:hypothetical protein